MRGIGQELAHRAGPDPESLLHALEGLEEGDCILDDLGAGHLGDGAQERLGGQADGPQRHPGGQEEGPEDPVLQEPGEAARCVEQVEGVAGGGRVDHHHVELARLDQLVELLHGHVLLGARKGAGQVLVEAVGQDPLGLLRGARSRCG